MEHKLIYSQQQVEQALDGMAAAMDAQYQGLDELVFLPVMIGAMLPASWLAARLKTPLRIDYVHATRYRGETVGKDLQWRHYPSWDFSGKTVLLFDDILDEGVTLKTIRNRLLADGASKVDIGVLVQKEHNRLVDGIQADFVGLNVPDEYVFGCGMDVNEQYRQLTAIYAMESP